MEEEMNLFRGQQIQRIKNKKGNVFMLGRGRYVEGEKKRQKKNCILKTRNKYFTTKLHEVNIIIETQEQFAHT